MTSPTLLPIHPRTGLAALGWTRSGAPIWPVMGGSGEGDSGAGSNDSGADGTDAPQLQDPTPPAEPDKGDTDWAAEAARWKSLARKHEDRVKAQRAEFDAAKAKASEYDKLVEASRTEQEKAIDAARAETRAEFEAVALRFEIALDKGLPKALAKRLQGSTREELEADADELLKLQPAATPPPPPDLGQGRRATAKPSGVAAGRDLWAQHHPKVNASSS